MPPKDRIDHTRSTAVTSDSGALGLNRFMRSFVFFMPRIANSAKGKECRHQQQRAGCVEQLKYEIKFRQHKYIHCSLLDRRQIQVKNLAPGIGLPLKRTPRENKPTLH